MALASSYLPLTPPPLSSPTHPFPLLFPSLLHSHKPRRLKVHGGADIVTFDLHPFGTGLDLELLAAHSSPPATTAAPTATPTSPLPNVFPQPVARGQRSLTLPASRTAAVHGSSSDAAKSAGRPVVSPPPAVASRSATTSATVGTSGVSPEPRGGTSFREEIATALMDNCNGVGGSSSRNGRMGGSKGKGSVAVEPGCTFTNPEISAEDATSVSPNSQAEAEVVTASAQAAQWPVPPSAPPRNKSPRGSRAAAAAAARAGGLVAGGTSKPLPAYMTQSVPLTPAMLAAIRAAEEVTDSEYDTMPPKIYRTDSTGEAQVAAVRTVTRPGGVDRSVSVGISRSVSNRMRGLPVPAPRPQGYAAQSVPFTPAMLAGLRAADEDDGESESDMPPPRVHRTDSTGAAQAAVLAGAQRRVSSGSVSSARQTGGSARLPLHMTQSVPLTPAMLAAIRAAEEGSDDESDMPPKIHRTDSTAAKQAAIPARQQEVVLEGNGGNGSSSGQAAISMSAIRAATAAAVAAARERASAQPRRSYTTQSVPFTPDMVAATIAAAGGSGAGGWMGEEDEEEDDEYEGNEGGDIFDTWNAQAAPARPMTLAEELAATTPPRLSGGSDRQEGTSPGAGGGRVGKSPFPPTGKKGKKGRSLSGGKSSSARRPAGPLPGSPALPAYYNGPNRLSHAAASATSARSMPMTPEMVAMILAMDGDNDEEGQQEEGYGLRHPSGRGVPSSQSLSRKGPRHPPRGVAPLPLKASHSFQVGSYATVSAVKAQGRLSMESRLDGQARREARRGKGGGGSMLDTSPPSSFRTHSLPFTAQMTAAALAANADEDEDGDGGGYYFDAGGRLPPSFTGWAGDIAPVIPSSSSDAQLQRRSKQSVSPPASSPTAAMRAVAATSQGDAQLPTWVVRTPVVTSPFKQILSQGSFKGGDIVRSPSVSLSQESLGSQEESRKLTGSRVGDGSSSGRKVGWADVKEEEDDGTRSEGNDDVSSI